MWIDDCRLGGFPRSSFVIPAKAGIWAGEWLGQCVRDVTWVGAGCDVGEGAGVTWEGVGMTWVDSRLRGNDVGGCGSDGGGCGM